MRNIYGEMILKEGSILYHITDEENFVFNETKPILYCTFHPSDYYHMGKNVVFIKIKKDLSICFMIDEIKNKQIICSLNEICENKYTKTFLKTNSENLIYFSRVLKESKFDGWFTSIRNNKSEVEVALLNDNNLFSIIKTEPLFRIWYKYDEIVENKKIIKKNWGKKYPICSDEKPIVLHINEKVKKYIDEYNCIGKEHNRIQLLTLQYILKNAQINVLDKCVIKDCPDNFSHINCPVPWYKK